MENDYLKTLKDGTIKGTIESINKQLEMNKEIFICVQISSTNKLPMLVGQLKPVILKDGIPGWIYACDLDKLK